MLTVNFPQLKLLLADQEYDDENEIKTAVQAYLANLTKHGVLFVFQKWHECLLEYIQLSGNDGVPSIW